MNSEIVFNKNIMLPDTYEKKVAILANVKYEVKTNNRKGYERWKILFGEFKCDENIEKTAISFSPKEFKKLLKLSKNEDNVGVDEFIGKDGDFIEGDMNTNKREAFVGINNPETSSEFAQQTAQGPRYYMGSQYGRSRNLYNTNIAENKMKKMIEDYMGKKNDDRSEIVNSVVSNEIPGLDKLKHEFNKPIIARKVMYLTEMMDREGINGEELAIVLNHLLSIENKDIPSQYKNILINKIKNG